MANTISRAKIEDFLKKDGDIFYIISQKEQTELKRLLFANKTNWTKITNLPEQVYHEFDMKMRSDCYVSEMKLPNPPEVGPHIIYEKRNNRISIKISNNKAPKGIYHYRKCLSVVGYYAGIRGGIINPGFEKGQYVFTDEDWIMISIAARYCLMPGKLIQKVLLLTKMYGEQGSLSKEKTFIESFVDNLVFQTDLPEWVVWTRLREHSFADDEFAETIVRYDVDKIIEDYRANEHYKDLIA